MGYFGAYEFLVYVVPGGIVLFFVTALFPRIRALFGKEPVNIGGLILFLVLAFVLGQLIQTVAIWTVQYGMEKAGLAYRTNSVLFTDTSVISRQDRARLSDRLNADFDFDTKDLQHKKSDQIDDRLRTEWRRLIGRLRTKVMREQRTDRLEVYGQNFAMNMSLAVAFAIVFAMLVIVHNVKPRTRRSLQIINMPKTLGIILYIAIAVGFAISLTRIAMFDRLYADELFGSYLHGKPK